MLRVGIAGIGFMGWIHWLAYNQVDGAEVVAICDTDKKRLSGDWTEIQGNFGPKGEQVDLSDIQCCDNLEEFCKLDFDVLDICLPPSMHVPMIIHGAKNGKHIFSEKPLSLQLPECDKAVRACSDANVILQVGHVLPFFPEYTVVRRLIDSGDLGAIKAAYFKRVISDPVWLQDFYDPQKIGGPLLDLHVHDAHFIRLIAGQPSGVYSSGLLKNDVVSFCHSIFDYENKDLVIGSTGGVIEQQGRPFMHGFEIQFELATLHFEFAALSGKDEIMPLKLLRDDGSVEFIEIGDGDPVNAFVAEIREMVSAVKAGTASPILSGDLARDAIQICHAESTSVLQRQRIVIR